MNPNSLKPDGSCPTCGRVVAEPGDADAAAAAKDQKAPWHFKLLVAVTVVYLAWRAVEMIGWVVN
jgi:hypothetical protein